MSHSTPSDRYLATTTSRVVIPVAVAVFSALLAAPASAEPQPWHNPEYVVGASGHCDRQGADKAASRSWSTRSRCPVRTTVTLQSEPNKAQIEHAERLAMPEPNKAQIEHAERLAMPERG